MFLKIKKHIALIVISGLLLFNFSPLMTLSARADLTGGSWASAAAGWASFAKYVLKEFGLDLAARLIARSQLTGALKGIANQVVQSGRTGRTPAFIQNWRNLMTDAEYRGEDVFRAVLGNTVQCPYFRNEILGTFGVGRIPPIPGNTQNIRTNNLDPFTLRGRCTMPQAWSIREYQRDFSGNGGWDALVRLSQPQNNFYGSLLLSMNELNNQRGLEARADVNEVTSGQGFIGVRKSSLTGNSCDTPPTNRAVCEDCTKRGDKWCFSSNSCVPDSDTACIYSTSFPSGCSAIPTAPVFSQARCTFLGNVSTPSKILGEGAAEFIDSNLKWLTTSDEISEVLGNFIQAMLNKLANYAADTIAGDARDPKADKYQACIRQCNNTSSGSQYAACVDKCARDAGVDLPPKYDDFANAPPPPPGPFCGDGVCNVPNENTTNCPADCGTTPLPQCGNLLNDDPTEDQAIDFNGGPNGEPPDPGCSSFQDNSELNTVTTPECSDGIDNEADGQADFAGANGLPADTDCRSATDNNEITFMPLLCSGLNGTGCEGFTTSNPNLAGSSVGANNAESFVSAQLFTTSDFTVRLCLDPDYGNCVTITRAMFPSANAIIPDLSAISGLNNNDVESIEILENGNRL